MKIIKEPDFENDSFYFIIEPEDELVDIRQTSQYYKDKSKMFTYGITAKSFLEHYKHKRKSLYNLDNVEFLDSTNYVYAFYKKNNIKQFSLVNFTLPPGIVSIMKKQMKIGRRCYINFANNLCDYLLTPGKDVSCLLGIHYMEHDVKLIFRASDMADELLIDLSLINKFFIKPIYGDSKISTHVFSSTAQSIINLKTLIQ